MDLSLSSHDRLKELATCAVCLDLLRHPKMLPCQHTFCLSCVEKLATNESKEPLKLRCAQCRGISLTPRGGVAALPGNIYLQSILDLIASEDTTASQVKKQCSSCQTVCDVEYCQHCNISLCTICTQKHLSELKYQLHAIRDQLESANERVTARLKNLLESCSNMKVQICLEIQERIQKLVSTEERLLQEVDKIGELERASAAELSRRLEGNASRVQDLISCDFQPAVKVSEKVDMFLQMHKESSDALSAVDALPLWKISFCCENLTLTSSHQTPQLPATNSDEDIQAPELSSLSSAVSLNVSLEGVSGRSEEHNDPDNVHSVFYRSRHFVTRFRFGPAFMQRPSGVAVSPWSNEFFVVSMDTHRICVFDLERGKYMRSFGVRGHRTGEFLCPYGIALSPVTQEILVTDKWKHCIHVFDSSGRFVRQIGSQGSGAVHFRSPESICVDQEGRMYICDTCNKRIQVLDKDGCFLREIDGPTRTSTRGVTKRCVFQEPSGIAVTRDGQRIVVCDCGNHRIHVFNQQGALLMTFGQKGSLRGQFNNPECVAIDSKGFIFVGDSGNGRVQILRPDGRFVKAFGNKGSTTSHFNWISGIAITHNFDIVVSDFKNHCIQVF